MSTTIAIEQMIKDYMVGSAGVSPDKLDDPERKLSELGLDSLSVIEMLFEVEDKYGVHVDDPMPLKELNLRELYAFIAELVENKQDSSKNAGSEPVPAPAGATADA
ncbi:acyl carrier protein [Tahibacter amnicola]|uniref:Acyl carrier protein n=1 Tax=Tahibacter amnicola TaxID=2976241 RepID=A0ABY6B8H9_9GAMM|nr:acyl carrier protein [Tahibacter amnicola]UXI66180.1 acyl carrier protein [Tahibacter amnicola]